MKQAAQLQRQGQWAGAAQLYESVLVQEPGNLDALRQMGLVCRAQGQHARAVEFFERAVACAPDIAADRIYLADSHRALSQWAPAEAQAREAVRLAPDNSDAIAGWGLALHGLGRREEAAGQFGRLVALRPEMAAAQAHLGVILGELGRFDEAAASFGRAIAIDPQNAPARINLGRLLLQFSRSAEALPHLECAVRLRPDLAELHRNLGNALHGLGRLAEARAAYVETLRLDPSLVMAQANLALALEHLGQLDEALRWLQRALDAQPKNVVFWQQLAELQLRRVAPLESLKCWEKMLELEPQSARGHVALGRALQKKGRTDEAAEHFRLALRLQPDLVDAYDHLAKLHQELGETEQAEAAARASGRLRPGSAAPLAALAMLLGGRLPQADLDEIAARVADAQLGDEPRRQLLFALAHTLDARGDYAGAATRAREANRLALATAQRCGRAYVPAQHERFVSGLLEAFGADFFARMKGAGLSNRRPVFVFGLPRSGTSVVEQILASHPAVFGAGELLLVAETFEAIPAAVGSRESPLACVPRLTAGTLSRLAARHLDALAVYDQGRFERVVDKAPQNYQFVGLLAALFPQATLIHCRRDLRDVAVSCWMTEFEQVSWAQDAAHIASHFRQYRRLMEHWQGVLPGRLHEVDYENTVSDLEGVARGLVAACQLDWDPACLDFHLTRRPVRTQSATQVRQPIYTRSVGRWRHYEQELADLFERLPIQ